MYSQVFIIQIIYIGQNNSCARRKTEAKGARHSTRIKENYLSKCTGYKENVSYYFDMLYLT